MSGIDWTQHSRKSRKSSKRARYIETETEKEKQIQTPYWQNRQQAIRHLNNSSGLGDMTIDHAVATLGMRNQSTGFGYSAMLVKDASSPLSQSPVNMMNGTRNPLSLSPTNMMYETSNPLCLSPLNIQ